MPSAPKPGRDDGRTIYDLVRNALQIQRATNLQGVVLNFCEDFAQLRTLLEKKGPVPDATLRRHPVCVLYAGRIATLTGSEVGLRMHRAFEWCESMLQQSYNAHTDLPLPQDPN